MKVSFAGLCLFSFLLCVFLSCDEGMEIADDIIISEPSTEIADDVPQWRRVPELDITFKIPDELLTGKIAMSKTNSVDFDVSFMISLGSATFYEEHVYMADSSGMHIYVFDMDGNLLPDKTLKRKEIYSREGNRSNHAGNVDADNNIKYAVVDNGRAGSLSISDSLLGMYVHNDIFYLEILWQPAYKGSTISRYHLWWVNIVVMHLSTGEFSVIDTLPNVSWEGDERWFELTEREYAPSAEDLRYVREQGLLRNRNIPSDLPNRKL